MMDESRQSVGGGMAYDMAKTKCLCRILDHPEKHSKLMAQVRPIFNRFVVFPCESNTQLHNISV